MKNEVPKNEMLPVTEYAPFPEASVVESPEAQVTQMEGEAEIIINSFCAECGADVERITAQAESMGVAVDPEDTAALRAILSEAEAARQQLSNVLSSSDMPYQLSTTERAEINRDAVVDRITFSKESIARLESEIQGLDAELEELRSSFLKRIINFRSIGRKERLKTSRQQGIAIEQKAIEEDEALKLKYESILEAEAERERILQEEQNLREEAERQRIAVEQSERPARNVAKLMEQYGCYFVHNIVDDEKILKSNATMAENGTFNAVLDDKELDWSDRIDIVCGLEPTLSVSTISKPEQATYRDDKSTFTLLLKGGRVLAGSQGELWTVAKGLKERIYTEESSKLENIGKAIIERGDISYNELVVADPQVAGVAFSWPTSSVPEEFTPEYVSDLQGWDNELTDKYDELWKKMPKLLEKKMNIFVMVKNQPRVLYDIDVSQRSFKVAPVPDMPKDIAHRSGIGKLERREAMNRVIDRV